MIPHSKPFIDETDHQAVREALASGMIAQGARVRQFERVVAAFLGRTGRVAVHMFGLLACMIHESS
jgi:dTDP-4-amino-4,6-dideoxygalactose transaminase